MYELMNNEIKTMSSLEIAKITGKTHDNVLKDIRRILDEAEIGVVQFNGSYISEQNKILPCYNLPRLECDLIVSGYSTKYRLAIIKRWHELESNNAQAIENTYNPVSVAKTAKAMLSLAKTFGLKGNQALLKADRATKTIEGYSPLALLQIELIADVKEPLLNATDLGKRIGLTPQKMNTLLENEGFQIAYKNSKGAIQWELTNKGKSYSDVLDVNKKGIDGTVKQIKWYPSVLDAIGK